MTKEFSEAITETLDILQHMDKEYTDRISPRFKKFLEDNQSTTYKPNLDHSKDLKDMNISEKTKNILAILYMNYWCDEANKEKYKMILKENEKSYQKEIKAKYNTDNLFKNKKTEEIEIKEETQALVEYKQKTFIQKVWDKIKSIFKIK